jgi:hypothetical protein
MEFFGDIIQFYHPSSKHTSGFAYLASLLAAFHEKEGMLDEQPLGLHKESCVYRDDGITARHTIAQSTQLPRARKVITAVSDPIHSCARRHGPIFRILEMAFT